MVVNQKRQQEGSCRWQTYSHRKSYRKTHKQIRPNELNLGNIILTCLILSSPSQGKVYMKFQSFI